MKYIVSLDVGDRFRLARATQVSFNMKAMRQSTIFVVTRKYPQHPYTVVAKVHNKLDGDFYSLPPSVPIIRPKELIPTEQEVLRFLSKSTTTKKPLHVRVNWDGKTDLRPLVSPKAAAILKILFVFGQQTYAPHDMEKLLEENLRKFHPKAKTSALFLWKKELVSRGLLEEVIDEPSSAELEAAALREAGIVEENTDELDRTGKKNNPLDQAAQFLRRG